MGLVAQNGIAHVIVVGYLHVIKQDDILQLRGVAHHAVVSHQCAAPDKGALAHLRPMANDAGAVEIGGFEHRGVLRHPDVLQNLAVPVGGMVILLLRQLLSDFQNQVGDPGQRFPRIGKPRQIVPGQRMAQVIEILDCQHYFFTSIRWPLRSMASMI